MKTHYLSSVIPPTKASTQCGIVISDKSVTIKIERVTCLTCLYSLQSKYRKIYDQYDNLIDKVDVQTENIQTDIHNNKQVKL